MVRAAVPAVGGTGNHADFGHEPLAFTEPVARQPDHLLHHLVPRPLAPPGQGWHHAAPGRGRAVQSAVRSRCPRTRCPAMHRLGGGLDNEHAASESP